MKGWPALLAAFLALSALAAGVLLEESRLHTSQVSPLPSSSNPGPHGLAAARELLLETGATTFLRQRGDLEPGPTRVLVLAAPRAQIPQGEVDLLLKRAFEGATVIVTLGGTAQPALLDRLGLEVAPGADPRVAHPLSPHPLFFGLDLPASSASILAREPGTLAVSGGDGFVSAVSIEEGKGEVLVFSGPEPLENAHLVEGDAATLLLRLGKLGPVVFDERFLAKAAAAPPPSQSALLLLAGQLLLAGGALTWSRARRLGAIRPPPKRSNDRTSRDYLASLSILYRRAGAEEQLARESWSALRRRLERMTGIPARLSDAEAARRAQPRSQEAALALARGGAALAAGGGGVLLNVTCAAADAEAALSRGLPPRAARPQGPSAASGPP